MIIPRLFYEDCDENGKSFMRPCSTDDIDNLVEILYEAAIGLSMVRQEYKERRRKSA